MVYTFFSFLKKNSLTIIGSCGIIGIFNIFSYASSLPSLFLTPEQAEQIQEKYQPFSSKLTPFPSSSKEFHLYGILLRSDTNEWVIWVNGKRFESSGDKCIEDWSISSVTQDHVILISPSGEEKVLSIEYGTSP